MNDEYVNAFEKLIGREREFYVRFTDSLTKFLNLDTSPDILGKGVYKIVGVKPDDDNLLFDISYKLSYNFYFIREPTLNKSLYDVSHDLEFVYTATTLKVIDPDLPINVSDKLFTTLKLPIKYINNMLDVLQNKTSNITYVLERIIEDKSSVGFQDLVAFKDKIEKAKNKVFEFIRLAYEGTDDISESCADKDVMTILHELYDEKI